MKYDPIEANLKIERKKLEDPDIKPQLLNTFSIYTNQINQIPAVSLLLKVHMSAPQITTANPHPSAAQAD